MRKVWRGTATEVAVRASVEQADTDNGLKGVKEKRGDLETERD